MTSVESMSLQGCVPSLQARVDLAWHFPFPRLFIPSHPFSFSSLHVFLLVVCRSAVCLLVWGGGCEV